MIENAQLRARAMITNDRAFRPLFAALRKSSFRRNISSFNTIGATLGWPTKLPSHDSIRPSSALRAPRPTILTALRRGEQPKNFPY